MTAQQKELCERFGSRYVPPSPGSIVGISMNVRSGLLPLNGLRHPENGETSGWYIWAGEQLSNEPDFFKPLHTLHLTEWCPGVEKFLGLAPGWRFLKAGDYEDVWFDPALLDV
jgi:hypothetical protein